MSAVCDWADGFLGTTHHPVTAAPFLAPNDNIAVLWMKVVYILAVALVKPENITSDLLHILLCNQRFFPVLIDWFCAMNDKVIESINFK